MLTEDQINTYNSQGFLHIADVFAEEVLSRVRGEIQRLCSEKPVGLVLNYEPALNVPLHPTITLLRKIRNVARFSQPILSCCISPPLTIIAKDILGPEIGFYGDQVLFKQPRIGSAKPLHQDAAYFRIEPSNGVITFWCALDDADESNGCMHYVLGSHKCGLVAHTSWVGTSHLVADVNETRLVPVPVRAGDCIVHNSLTLHSTPPNKSSRSRWAILMHYVRLDSKFPPRSAQATPVLSLN